MLNAATRIRLVQNKGFIHLAIETLNGKVFWVSIEGSEFIWAAENITEPVETTNDDDEWADTERPLEEEK